MIRSEDHILALLDEFFPRSHKLLRLGRGDDCAELEAGGPLALSSDLFLEDIHFRRAYFLPEEIGHKALAVNVSDLASAGAAPLGFSLGLICPKGFPLDDLRVIFRGMSALAGRYNMALSGGDISAGDKLGFSITVWGAPARTGAAFLRRGATPDDAIFVVGAASPHCSLGLARNGLRLLEEDGRAALGAAPASCGALLRPQPQVEAGQILAQLHGRVGLMDISDGLLRDLPRLLGVHGAELDFDLAILHPELGRGSIGPALSGGDDYLLLGAAPADLVAEAAKSLSAVGLRLDVLGRVLETPGLFRQGEPLDKFLDIQSFDHFERSHE